MKPCNIIHLGRWLLHDSLRLLKLQPRFEVCNISYLRVLFHSYIHFSSGNAFFTTLYQNIVTWMHSFLLIFLWFKYHHVSNSNELWNNTRRYEILHTSNLGCSFNSLRESCNNQQMYDIAWLHVTNHLYHGYVTLYKC
jgi:hypothetical protein